MARQPRRDLLAGSSFTIEQEQAIQQVIERHLVKLGLLNHRRCAACEHFSPIGAFCTKHDDVVPAEFQPTGCDEWQQLMPF